MIRNPSTGSFNRGTENTIGVALRSSKTTTSVATTASSSSTVSTSLSRVPLTDRTNTNESSQRVVPRSRNKDILKTNVVISEELANYKGDMDFDEVMRNPRELKEKAIVIYRFKVEELKKLIHDGKSEDASLVQSVKKYLSYIELLSSIYVATPRGTRPSSVADIDISDNTDPQAVSEYVLNIHDYLLQRELESLLLPNFMEKQKEITERMRSILMDWLVEVHRMFKLLPETLFLTAYIIDTYLQLKEVSRDNLQLIGITAMLIASKYEEIYAPECNDFVYISDGAYTKRQILEMENKILTKLDFKLTTPLSLQFLRRYSKAAGSDYSVHTLCKFILETMILDANIHTFQQSLLACSSVYIARKMTGSTELWDETMHYYTSYPESKVRECAEYVNQRLKITRASTTLRAIEKKYSLAKFGQVTSISLVEL